MNNRLSDSDYALLLASIEALHECRRLEDFPNVALAELRKIVACNMACYAELDYERKRAVHVFDPPMGLPKEWFAELIKDHPVLNYFTATGDGQALKISDFLSVPDFHRLRLYQEAFRHTHVEDELGFGVQVEKRFVLGFALHRDQRSYTERDRAMLNLIRPHIMQAYIHLEELAGHEELQRGLQTALRENGLGVIVLNEAREIVHSTPGAFESLAGYIPVPDDARKLPEKLERWAFSEGDGQANASLVLPREAARLIIRRKRQDRNRLLLLVSEESSAAAAQRLAQFNLTPREHEVLRWIGEGKSNGEIATILGVSLSTSKTHVERILAKLGVENRTAAAMVLRSIGF